MRRERARARARARGGRTRAAASPPRDEAHPTLCRPSASRPRVLTTRPRACAFSLASWREGKVPRSPPSMHVRRARMFVRAWRLTSPRVDRRLAADSTEEFGIPTPVLLCATRPRRDSAATSTASATPASLRRALALAQARRRLGDCDGAFLRVLLPEGSGHTAPRLRVRPPLAVHRSRSLHRERECNFFAGMVCVLGGVE